MDILDRERIMEYQNYIEEHEISMEYEYACSECFFLNIVKGTFCDCDECRLGLPNSLDCYAVYERILK